jgi:hypothetical protein
MQVYWKPIITEVLLELLLELAPGSIDMLATVAEYIQEISLETSKASIQLVLANINDQVELKLPYASYTVASPTIA